jgi:hypothetical protein
VISSNRKDDKNAPRLSIRKICFGFDAKLIIFTRFFASIFEFVFYPKLELGTTGVASIIVIFSAIVLIKSQENSIIP